LLAHGVVIPSQTRSRSAGAMYAASKPIGEACFDQTDDFLLCRADNDNNPFKCVEQGKAITRCALGVFQKIYAGPCADSFRAYVAALERNNLEFDRVRAEEKVFDRCYKQ
jgi:NADH dehydrogenase (ubiquinone) 1 alpha subcomplex subunit 8